METPDPLAPGEETLDARYDPDVRPRHVEVACFDGEDYVRSWWLTRAQAVLLAETISACVAELDRAHAPRQESLL